MKSKPTISLSDLDRNSCPIQDLNPDQGPPPVSPRVSIIPATIAVSMQQPAQLQEKKDDRFMSVAVGIAAVALGALWFYWPVCGWNLEAWDVCDTE